MVFKLGGIAIAVAVLASAFGTMLPVGVKPLPQRDRIIKSAQVAGASNVRIRAAEAEARRAPIVTSSIDQPPVVLPPPASLSTPVSQSEDSNADQSVASAYTGTAPLPQTSFSDAAEAALETADEPDVED